MSLCSFEDLTQKYGIGITGGIGSGKSAVADILRQFGFVVIDADALSRKAVEPGQPAHREIIQAFGSDILKDDGTIDRQKLGKKVFHLDQEGSSIQTLEAIIHPKLPGILEAELQREGLFLAPRLWFYEAALLFESGKHQTLRETWLVEAPDAVRIARLQSRRGMKREDAEAVIARQMPSESKRALAQLVIENSGSLAELKESLQHLLQTRGYWPPDRESKT